MSEESSLDPRESLVSRALEITIRVGVLLLLAAWCFQIVRPFVNSVLWGIVIAVATRAFYVKVAAATGNRRGIAAAIFIAIGFVLIIGPTLTLSGTVIDGAQTLFEALNSGTLKIPPPPEGVASWPIIGQRVEQFWTLSSQNLEQALQSIQS